MRKVNLILGIVFMSLSLVGLIIFLVVPHEQIYFNIGFGIWPLGPAVVFFVLGVIFLATARIGQPEEPPAPATVVDPEKAALNKQLETYAFGAFLILLGLSMFWRQFFPAGNIPDGLWSICVGLVFLGLNAARYLNKIKMSGFTTVLGILSVVGGIVQLLGVKNMEGAFLLIILGVYFVMKRWFDERKIFGKAEEG